MVYLMKATDLYEEARTTVSTGFINAEFEEVVYKGRNNNRTSIWLRVVT